MLEKVLRHIKNWFPVSIYPGKYTIENGSITLPFLLDGQYFRVMGSVFNDGLHKYPEELTDEAFEGTIWALAVPPAVVELAEEIKVWNDKNGAAGPYTSESFGGYSYTRATNAQGAQVTWQDAFRGRLNEWRRL